MSDRIELKCVVKSSSSDSTKARHALHHAAYPPHSNINVTMSNALASNPTAAPPKVTWKSGVVVLFLLLGLVAPLLVLSWIWGGPGFCPAVPMMSIMTNINDKMSQQNPDGGADLIWGTGVCTIYLKPYSDDGYDEVESSTNSFGIKIVMHEYVHCLQHGLVSGDADPSVTYDTIDVTVLNKCGIPEVYATKTIAAFADLPTEFRLIKKVVVFYACGNGYEFAQSEIETEVYGAGCPGMAPMNAPWQNLNGFGEGDAEYYSMTTIMPAVAAQWTTPYDGAADWATRKTNCAEACGLPGNDLFVIGDLSEPWVEDKMIRGLQDGGLDGCRNNCIGEVVMTFLLTRRPATTVGEVFSVWAGAGSVGFGESWEATMGESWQSFSRALERDANHTNDASSEGYPGQALGTNYYEEEMPAMLTGVSAALALVATGCLVKLALVTRRVLSSRNTGGKSIPK